MHECAGSASPPPMISVGPVGDLRGLVIPPGAGFRMAREGAFCLSPGPSRGRQHGMRHVAPSGPSVEHMKLPPKICGCCRQRGRVMLPLTRSALLLPNLVPVPQLPRLPPVSRLGRRRSARGGDNVLGRHVAPVPRPGGQSSGNLGHRGHSCRQADEATGMGDGGPPWGGLSRLHDADLKTAIGETMGDASGG